MGPHTASLFLALSAFLGLFGLIFTSPLPSGTTSIGHGMLSNITVFPPFSTAAIGTVGLHPRDEPQYPLEFMCKNYWTEPETIACVGTYERLPYTYERVESSVYRECSYNKTSHCFPGVLEDVPLEMLGRWTNHHEHGVLCEQFIHMMESQTYDHRCWGTESAMGLFRYKKTAWDTYTHCLSFALDPSCPYKEVEPVILGPNWPSPPTKTGTVEVPLPNMHHATTTMTTVTTFTMTPTPFFQKSSPDTSKTTTRNLR